MVGSYVIENCIGLEEMTVLFKNMGKNIIDSFIIEVLE